jgi:hypothetical protein
MKKTHITVLSAFAFIFIANVMFYHYHSGYSRFLLVNADDAYISMRYAENLVEGHGLTWNVGERPVEGYTNLLWVMVLALAGKLGIDMALCAKILGMASAVAGMVLAYFAANELDPESGYGLAGPMTAFVLAFNPSYVFWAGSGMESSFFAMLLLLSLFLYFKGTAHRTSYIAISIVFALASLVRPEGLLFFGLTLLHLCFWQLTRRKRFDAPTLLSMLLPFCLIIIPHYLWRFDYYGYLLPNTYYAKTGVNNPGVLGGIRYLALYLKSNPWSIGLLLTIPFFRAYKFILSFVYLSVVAYTSYVVAVGGDWLPFDRFFIPVLPWFAICFAVLVSRPLNHVLAKQRTSARRFLLLVVASMLVFCLNSRTLYTSAHRVAYMTKQHASILVAIGLHLGTSYPPGTEVAVLPAGAIPYYSGFAAVDMLGLNDVHIAHIEKPNLGSLDLDVSSIAPFLGPGHCKTDIPYVLARRPTLLVGAPDLTLFPNVPSQWNVEELFKDYDRKEYELVVDKLTSPGNPFFDRGIYLRYLRRVPLPETPQAGAETIDS